jgi:hypothetical protein
VKIPAVQVRFLGIGWALSCVGLGMLGVFRVPMVTLCDRREAMFAATVDRFVDRVTYVNECNGRHVGLDLWSPCS